jgi:TetR/AcrR family transcriptional regulator
VLPIEFLGAKELDLGALCAYKYALTYLLRRQWVERANKKTAARKRFPAEERRNQLISTAMELFAQRGFASTTTKAIAAAAGVSEAVIFQHFTTKEDLYAGILDYKAKKTRLKEWQDQLRKLAEREDDEALILSMVERILESNHSDPQFQRLAFQAVLSGHSLPKMMAQRILPLHRFLCDYIIKRQKQGVFYKCDPNVVVHAMVSLPSYYCLAKGIFGVDMINLPQRKMALSFTRLILRGLRTPDGMSRKKGKNNENVALPTC